VTESIADAPGSGPIGFTQPSGQPREATRRTVGFHEQNITSAACQQQAESECERGCADAALSSEKSTNA
jgi:hypothetical protein